MADAIQAACESLNSIVEYLATMRVCEIRQYLEFLGVQHVEVIGCVILFVLMQFTKFTIVLLLAILLAYGIFYLWDTFFPELSQFGKRSLKAFKNARTTADLPPFNFDTSTEAAPGEHVIFPKKVLSNAFPPSSKQMLLPLLSNSIGKNLQTISQQTDRIVVSKKKDRTQKDDINRRKSQLYGAQEPRVQYGQNQKEYRRSPAARDSYDTRKYRQDRSERSDRQQRSYLSSERDRDRVLSQAGRRTSQIATGSGGGGDPKRGSHTMRVPTVANGLVNLTKLPTVTSDTLRRLPNVTSGESRRTTKSKEDSRRLPVVTSGEMSEMRRVPKVTSNESRWFTPGEQRDSRRSSYPQGGGGESRRTSHGGGGESRQRRYAERSHPNQDRLQEERFEEHKKQKEQEQRPRQHRQSLKPDEGRHSRQRRISNSRSGITSRQFPEEHLERLKKENREFQARTLHASNPGHPFHRSNPTPERYLHQNGALSNPTSERALPLKQEHLMPGYHHSDRRESQRNTTSKLERDRDRAHRKPSARN
ncbi:uncharacterized protein Dana_GF18825 [Drosophila ananassae]|uniref:Uncharacterized protein n=1 Tax=Drosophila ananassae TaxID=7217 RepID=B3LZD0_DROAN|nr:uncharacterized protein LOC6501594 [Drosophila ananassae]XP_032312018.1 uncharacterized protein LOC6501594 [Drosophila ananassae]EDV44109.2 uncharacterized protein Dana_GF18825 [Drosophila ananassae]